jgi:hypothetical protein
MSSVQPRRWNIFARELQDILTAHQLRLGQLDDLGLGIHREKVGRLQRSLHSSAHFPTLSPEEIDRLISALQLTIPEQLQIRSALLATAVERILMDRVDPQIAYMAADDVFNILFAAMRAQPSTILAGVRGDSPADDTEESGDAAFEEALDRIDRATLALHLSRQATAPEAQRAHAQEAAESFAVAVTLLQRVQFPAQDSDEWRVWDEEARHGLQTAESLRDQNGQSQP